MVPIEMDAKQHSHVASVWQLQTLIGRFCPPELKLPCMTIGNWYLACETEKKIGENERVTFLMKATIFRPFKKTTREKLGNQTMYVQKKLTF